MTLYRLLLVNYHFILPITMVYFYNCYSFLRYFIHKILLKIERFCLQKCCLYYSNAGLPKKILKGKLSGDKNLLRNIREVDSYRSLHSEVFPVMRYIGPYTSCDPVLLVKIIRLGKCFMTKVVRSPVSCLSFVQKNMCGLKKNV